MAQENGTSLKIVTASDIEYEIKQLKIKGNNCYEQQNYVKAIKYYTKGIEHSIYAANFNDDDDQVLIQLYQSLLFNRATTHFKINNIDDALIDSSQCIKIYNDNKTSYKARYFRCKVYLHVGDYKNVIEDCDKILKAPVDLEIFALQQKAKQLKRQINNVLSTKKLNIDDTFKAMQLTMGQHRESVESHNNRSTDFALIISSKWWRKWCNIDANKKLHEIDMDILIVDNSDLIQLTLNNTNREEEIIEIASTYLNHHLLPNLRFGPENDYIILNSTAYQEMVQMGYKIQPQIWVKKVEQFNGNTHKMEKTFEIYQTKYTVYLNKKKICLLCSVDETVRRIYTVIARYFCIQSSLIRLRYKHENGLILNRTHTLAQHQVLNTLPIYVEIRPSNGCWKIKSNEIKDGDSEYKEDKPTIVCQTCQRLITYYVDCSKKSDHDCTAKYCNISHAASHIAIYHEQEHQFHFHIAPRLGLTGIENLGNIDYMTSALQCLSHVSELRSYLTSNDYRNDINRENPLGYKGELANIFASFLKKMWFGLDDIASPIDIWNKIASLHDEWNTSRQRDAAAFIHWILNGLHEDLNLILKKPYYELKDSNGRNDEIVANEHWTLHLKRNQSIINDLFEGQYKSTLTCPSCNHESIKFDTFSVLTLPVPNTAKMISVKCLVFPFDVSSYPYKLIVNVSINAVVTHLRAILSKKVNEYLQNKCNDDNDEKAGEEPQFSSDNLLVCTVSDNKFVKYWCSHRPIKQVMVENASKSIYIYQVKKPTTVGRKYHDLIQVRMNFYYKSHCDHRIFFADPIVFDIASREFTGNNLYKYFKKKFISFGKKARPIASMWLSIEGIDYKIIFSDQQIILTNDTRNVATINVEFSEREYKLLLYLDRPSLITGYLRIYKYQYMIPNDIQQLMVRFYPKFNNFVGSIDNMESDIKPKGYNKSLYDYLRLYTETEILETIWNCSNCNKKLEPCRQKYLWRLPEILIIHLNRFEDFGTTWKNNSEITVPIKGLNLKPYLSNTMHIDELNISKYDLFATVNHVGIITKMDGGHYYSCIRTDYSTQITNFYQHYNEVDEPKWSLFNDEKVQPISIDNLQYYAKNAYMLLYRRRDNI